MTGEGQYPEWEFFDTLDNVLGPKHSTEPPTVVEILQHFGPDDESQYISGQTTVPVAHSSAPSQITEIGETQPSGSRSQPTGKGTQPSGSETQPSGSRSKSKK